MSDAIAKICLFGGRENTEEKPVVKVLREFTAIAIALGRDRLDIEELVISLEEKFSVQEDKEKSLLKFLELSDEGKEDIVRSCTREVFSLTNLLLESKELPEGKSVSVLKRQLRYAKNPMERQLIQNELSSGKAGRGKHRFGKKCRRRK